MLQLCVLFYLCFFRNLYILINCRKLRDLYYYHLSITSKELPKFSFFYLFIEETKSRAGVLLFTPYFFLQIKFTPMLSEIGMGDDRNRR